MLLFSSPSSPASPSSTGDQPRRRSRVLLAAICSLAAIAALLAPGSSPATAQTGGNSSSLIFKFSGGGWGHGVGMSQYGSYGRAAAGHSAAQILGFYYPNTTIEPITVYQNVRVHLATTPSTTVQSSQSLTLAEADGTPIASTEGGTTLTVTRTSGTFTVTDTSGDNLCMVVPEPDTGFNELVGIPSERPGTAAAVSNTAVDDDENPDPEPVDECEGGRLVIQYEDGQPVTLGATGIRYARGELSFVATGSSMYVMAQKLNMDTYLYGLAEVPASWPTAALETQAIAGRSYAMETIARRRADSGWNLPWDMYSTVQDQAYLGYNHEVSAQASRWVAAVDATSEEVMTYGGNAIPAFYSSSNGGHSEDSGYVFFYSFPYLPAKPDSFDNYQNPFSTWERSYTSAELSRWIGASSLGSVGEIESITVRAPLGASGRTDKAVVTIYGSTRTITTNGWRLMAIINGGVGRDGGGISRMALSTKYTIEVIGDQPQGSFDGLSRSGTKLTVSGWFYDPDDAGSAPVEIWVDGALVTTVTASEPRFDTGVALQQGTNRGFSVTLNVTAAPHQVCVHGTNVGGGANLLLACRTSN